MENSKPPFDQIIKALSEKAPLKIDVHENVLNAFTLLHSNLNRLETDIVDIISNVDKRVHVKFMERGHSDLEFKISDDVLIFSMHTDSYVFPFSHPIWKTSYVQENNNRAYCGMISIYNFLTDSIKYNRLNDQGVLIGRIFINQENHFFVEGKKQLGYLFNDFENSVINDMVVRQLSEAAILYCLEYDLITPPFDHVKVISVQEMIEKSLSSIVPTGKRLGFKLQTDPDNIQ